MHLMQEPPHGIPHGYNGHTLAPDAATVPIGVAQYNPFAGRKILPGLVHAFGEPGQRQRDYMGGMPCKFHPGGKSFLDCIQRELHPRSRTASLRTTAKGLFRVLSQEQGEKLIAQCSKASSELYCPGSPFAGMPLSAFADRPPLCVTRWQMQALPRTSCRCSLALRPPRPTQGRRYFRWAQHTELQKLGSYCLQGEHFSPFPDCARHCRQRDLPWVSSTRGRCLQSEQHSWNWRHSNGRHGDDGWRLHTPPPRLGRQQSAARPDCSLLHDAWEGLQLP